MQSPAVVWVIPSLEAGGTERQLSLLAPHVAEAYRLTVVTLFRQGLFFERIRSAGIETICLQGRGLYDWSIPAKIRQVAASKEASIVHSFVWDANIHAALALRHRESPVLLTSRREIGSWRKRRHLWAERWTNRIARAVVVNSEAARRYTAQSEKVALERIHVVYNGVDFGAYSSQDRASARLALEIPEGALVLCTVGSLAEKKGHRDLLEALSGAELPSWILLIAGEGVLRSALEQKAKRLQIIDRVRFLGVRGDIPEILAATDILVHPSHSESMPNSVLEAMAAGVAVLATDVGGTIEAIHTGENGLLVSPRSPKDLAAGLQRLAHDGGLRAKLAQAARKTAAERFSLERASECLCGLYRGFIC